MTAAVQDLALALGARGPPGSPAPVDEERLAQALAPLTRLTRLHLVGCSLGAIPAEVAGITCCTVAPLAGAAARQTYSGAL